MAKNNLDCYVIPAAPLPLLLPVECVGAVIAKPQIEALAKAPAKWMQGYVNWENQLVPVLSYSALHDPEIDESKKRNARLVVLNPIPDAVRKANTGLICYGEVRKLTVDGSIKEAEYPKNIDKRYVEAIIRIEDRNFIIPKLTALGVAFSYF